MRAPFACVVLTCGTLLASSLALADGGVPILSEERGPLIVTLLAEPAPLRVGPAAFEVLVQSSETGEPLPATVVRLRLTDSDAGSATELHPEVTGRRLFHTARAELSHPGPWQIEVLVMGEKKHEAFLARLDVGPRESPASRYWPYIAATPLGVGLLALHQARSLSRLSARSRGTRRATPSRLRDRPGAPSGLP